MLDKRGMWSVTGFDVNSIQLDSSGVIDHDGRADNLSVEYI